VFARSWAQGLKTFAHHIDNSAHLWSFYPHCYSKPMCYIDHIST